MNNSQKKIIKYIDFCSGIGGFHIGMIDYKCILECNISKECRESYNTNYNIECEKIYFI